jgi:hypothetical protein
MDTNQKITTNVLDIISRSRNKRSPKAGVRAYARTPAFGYPFNSIFVKC